MVSYRSNMTICVDYCNVQLMKHVWIGAGCMIWLIPKWFHSKLWKRHECKFSTNIQAIYGFDLGAWKKSAMHWSFSLPLWNLRQQVALNWKLFWTCVDAQLHETIKWIIYLTPNSGRIWRSIAKPSAAQWTLSHKRKFRFINAIGHKRLQIYFSQCSSAIQNVNIVFFAFTFHWMRRRIFIRSLNEKEEIQKRTHNKWVKMCKIKLYRQYKCVYL